MAQAAGVNAPTVQLIASVSAGQAHNSKPLTAVLEDVRLPVRKGRSRHRPKKPAGDKGDPYPRVRA